MSGDIFVAAKLNCEREREMTEFEIATLQLQMWSIFVAAGVGILQSALIGCGLFMMHKASKHRDKVLDNQAKVLDNQTKVLEALLERTEDSARALRKLLERTP